MITDQQYVVLSLELHMFYGRIMKEHSFFLKAGFTPANANFSKTAEQYKQIFEAVLQNAVLLGNGNITPAAATSGEMVTDYTLGSEQKTEYFTGIDINQEITRLESKLYGEENPKITPALLQQVKQLNAKTKPQLEGLINFKTSVLNNVLSCRMVTMYYPLLLHHILHEAQMYRDHLNALQNRQIAQHSMQETELFWDETMMQHAQFIRGMLDPSEDVLINTADGFAKAYAALMEEARNATDAMIGSVTDQTLKKTIQFRDFKEAGTKGINECKIRGIILPLLADHVLREANHYIRMLKQLS